MHYVQKNLRFFFFSIFFDADSKSEVRCFSGHPSFLSSKNTVLDRP